jgi:hypothetical protein
VRKAQVTKQTKCYAGKTAAMDAVTEMTVKCSKDKTNARFEVLKVVLLKMPCQSVLYIEIIAVCSQIHTKHINTAAWGEGRIG